MLKLLSEKLLSNVKSNNAAREVEDEEEEDDDEDRDVLAVTKEAEFLPSADDDPAVAVADFAVAAATGLVAVADDAVFALADSIPGEDADLLPMSLFFVVAVVVEVEVEDSKLLLPFSFPISTIAKQLEDLVVVGGEEDSLVLNNFDGFFFPEVIAIVVVAAGSAVAGGGDVPRYSTSEVGDGGLDLDLPEAAAVVVVVVVVR